MKKVWCTNSREFKLEKILNLIAGKDYEEIFQTKRKTG